MDSDTKIKRKPNPRQNCNIFSKITFGYTLPLFLRGFQKELTEDDLYEILPDYKAENLGTRAEQEWDKTNLKNNRSVFRVMWALFGNFYLLLGLTKILSIGLNVVRPIIMAKFVFYFVPGQTDLTKTDAYLYSVLLIIVTFAEAIYRQNYFVAAESLAVKFRTAVSSLIYRKSLNLSLKHAHGVHFGKIANFLTRDVNVLEFFFFMFHETWSGLVIVAIICYNMYQRIGTAVFVVLGAFALLIFCLVLLGIKVQKLRVVTCERTDLRIQTFREVLCQIRSAKMFVWEESVEKTVTKARRKEMDALFNMSMVIFLMIATSILMYHVTYYLLLMTCIWMGQTLNAETMYFVTSGFQSMAFYVITAIPYATANTSQVSAVLKRLQAIMESLDVKSQDRVENATDQPRIEIRNLTFTTIFKNIDLVIGPGLTLLLGNASSGKTVLLMTILREFDICEDSLVVEGRISYVSQEPWLFPSTIRQNILFGSNYDEKRYQNVIKVCSLDYDFRTFQNGDSTIVSEGGTNLSKGQQSRICLARAIYKDSDIYLFDDCLSNLDPVVAKQVFNNCILKFLRAKLVVLVSNNPSLVPYARNVITLQNGSAKLVRQECQKPDQDVPSGVHLPNLEHTDEPDDDVTTKLIPDNRSKIYAEEKKIGAVSLKAYRKYVELGGGKLLVFTIFCVYVVGQCSFSYKDKLISDWAKLEDQVANSTEDMEPERTRILYVYTATTLLSVFVILFRGYLLYLFMKKASVNLHKRMLNSVLNASVRFFDNTFIGTIVNRFSKDLVTIDENLPFNLLHLGSITFETVGNLILISFINVRFLIPTAILLICFVVLRNFYLKTGRPLKRLEAITKGPVLGYLNTTLKGLPTIKTFHAERILKEEFDKHQDLYTSASHSNLFCTKAFVFAADIVASIFIAVVILKYVLFSENVSASDVGLAVSQASVMCSVLYFGIAKWADLEVQMTSAERCFEYTRLQRESRTGLVLKQWPQDGKIEYKSVFLTVNASKAFILKNLNFVVEPKEKVAVVGRTGAGKSSIISTLFRLYEAEGSVTIDGVNIKTLALDCLRSNISVIPQDPLLLNGTLRFNIDPEGKYSDDDIWNVIEKVKLKQLFSQLDAEIADSEITFTQKQLICLARVLIKKNRILLLDEITENGDSDSESLIYDIVDKNFAASTVIKITHKMKFAMNCDKVMVLDGGEIVEYGSPDKLLSNKKGFFSRMVKESDLNL